MDALGQPFPLTTAFFNHRDRGVRFASFQVLREANMPACLVELEFISNDDQAKWLADETNQEKIADALAAGLENYFEIEK